VWKANYLKKGDDVTFFCCIKASEKIPGFPFSVTPDSKVHFEYVFDAKVTEEKEEGFKFVITDSSWREQVSLPDIAKQSPTTFEAIYHSIRKAVPSPNKERKPQDEGQSPLDKKAKDIKELEETKEVVESDKVKDEKAQKEDAKPKVKDSKTARNLAPEFEATELKITPYPEKEITISNKIGEGNNANVHAVTYQGKVYALKEVNIRDSNHESMLLREAKIHWHSTHPNIVQLYYIWRTDTNNNTTNIPPSIYFLQEKMDGDLFDFFLTDRYFNKTEKVPFKLILQIAQSVAGAVEYLHNQPIPILYRDLKLENVLFRYTNKVLTDVKLTDFGVSREHQDKRALTMGFGTTLEYASPELLESLLMQVIQLNSRGGKPVPTQTQDDLLKYCVTLKSDVFSFGRLLQAMLFKTAAPPNSTSVPSDYPDLPVEFNDLLVQCLSEYPADRPTFSKIIEVLDKM